MRTDKIGRNIYDGYVWWSDKSKPQVLHNEQFGMDLTTADNPFVVEAQLCSHDRKESYNVRFVDGQYVAHKYNIDDNDEHVDYTYLGNRIVKDNRHYSLKFRQVWRESECEGKSEDDACLGMPVLEPKELVFVGLEETKEEQK